MELKEILAISKLPGLYQIVTSRDNGLIVTPLGEEKRKFIASRQHMFTPLENITVYTNVGSMELAEIFKAMKSSKTSAPDVKAADKEIREYFTEIAPDHDQQRVYISDIRKMMKWFIALDAQGMFKEKEKTEKKAKAEPKDKAASATKKATAKKAKGAKEEKKAPKASKTKKK